MTPAEINRYQKSVVWRMQKDAYMDYTQANLFGISIARLLDSKNEYPTIDKVYPFLFEEEASKEQEKQKQEEKRMIDSQNRFLDFAIKHNAKMREEVNKKNGNDGRNQSQDNG